MVVLTRSDWAKATAYEPALHSLHVNSKCMGRQARCKSFEGNRCSASVKRAGGERWTHMHKEVKLLVLGAFAKFEHPSPAAAGQPTAAGTLEELARS